jgi:hypothetical protein
MIYHCGNKEGQIGLPICEHLGPKDKVVPYEKVHSDTGRHFNCPNCFELLRTFGNIQ